MLKINSIKKSKKKGFTLLELLVVVAIMVVLGATLIPIFVSQLNKANNAADQTQRDNIATLVMTYDATSTFGGFVATDDYAAVTNEFGTDVKVKAGINADKLYLMKDAAKAKLMANVQGKKLENKLYSIYFVVDDNDMITLIQVLYNRKAEAAPLKPAFADAKGDESSKPQNGEGKDADGTIFTKATAASAT